MVDEKTEVPYFIFLHPFSILFPEQTHTTAVSAHPRGLNPNPKRCARAWKRRGVTVSSTHRLGETSVGLGGAGRGATVSSMARVGLVRPA
jgi:hypothetical protein